MVLIRFLMCLLLAAAIAAPAGAHKKHKDAEASAQPAEAAQPQGAPVVDHPMSPAVHEAVKDDIERLEKQAALPVHERLLDWLGRIHPFAVHFPLALFPISLVALILARRRGGAVDLIGSLIIVAGASAAGAALLGWFNGGFTLADKDPLLLWHRWLGTAIAVAGAALALLTWRRPSAVNSRGTVIILALLTLTVLVQGWFGGALIHGIDHLNW